MRFVSIGFVALFALAFAHGCSGSKECVRDADCSGGENCAYATGCSAKGVCKAWDNQCDDPPHPVCGCTGATVFVGCGYPGTPVPSSHDGYCATPVGGACNGPNDCDPRALCAFPVADGCAAKGTCVDPNHTCVAPSLLACGCDGNPVGIACSYGDGNAAAPVRHIGACEAGAPDAGADASTQDAAAD